MTIETGQDRVDLLAANCRETLERSGNCAQTSFSVLQEEFGLDGKQILKALTPFPGIALRGETCGAVVGSLMALGLVFGREDLEDWDGYIASLPAARRFCRRFEKENGSTVCGSILEAKLGKRFNLADGGEAVEYLSAGGREACAAVIISAVQIAAELMRSKA
ncbi:MAG: C-GCAxxG-C-C family protein [Chloroflexi bacterium]|nr:C-GCAxxG-C-C family protein [Chloroflexota bacterium]MCL5952721.1 C-GCAxxG-C-C family protein [Chloroflexota bacterium]